MERIRLKLRRRGEPRQPPAGEGEASPPPDGSRSATLRFRLKGQTAGPVYQGQRLVIPCRACGKK